MSEGYGIRGGYGRPRYPPPPPPPPLAPTAYGSWKRFNGVPHESPPSFVQPPVPGEEYYRSAHPPLPPPPLSQSILPPPPPPHQNPYRERANRPFRPYSAPAPPRPSIPGHNGHRGFYANHPQQLRPPRHVLPPERFPPHPPPPMRHFEEPTFRVRRTFIHDNYVPSNYDNTEWSPAPSQAILENSNYSTTNDVKDPNGEVETLNGNLNSSVATSAFLQSPLQPPPMPPLFNISMAEPSPELKVVGNSLPFIPVAAERIDLAQMTKAIEEEKIKAGVATLNILEKQGVIEMSWPMELREMFQPLFCKLCTLTLSSAVVAKDHYMGKKHKKCIENWLYTYQKQHGGAAAFVKSSQQKSFPFQKFHKAKTDNFPSTAVPTGVASARIIPSSEVPSLFPAAKIRPPPPPITGSNTTPLGNPGDWRKRSMEVSLNVPGKAGISKRFPLGKPPPKKLKSDPNAGPNFDHCALCNLALTSPSHAEQHYSGQKHKKKLAETKTIRQPPPSDLVYSAPLPPDALYAAPRPLPQIRPPLHASFQYF